jgi:hypothetical protein
MVRTAFLKKGRKEHIMGRIQLRHVQPAYNSYFSTYFFSQNSIFSHANQMKQCLSLCFSINERALNYQEVGILSPVIGSKVVKWFKACTSFLPNILLLLPSFLKNTILALNLNKCLSRFKNRIKFFLWQHFFTKIHVLFTKIHLINF